MKFLGNMSIYNQIAYHRLFNTFGNKTGASKSAAPVTNARKPSGSSLLQKDWGRQKGATHA